MEKIRVDGNDEITIWMFPKIGGKPPKWMVKIMENPTKMDDLGGFPIIFGNTHFHPEKNAWFEGTRYLDVPLEVSKRLGSMGDFTPIYHIY